MTARAPPSFPRANWSGDSPEVEVSIPFELTHQIEQVFLLSAGDEFL